MKRKPSFSKRCLGTMLPAVLFLLATTGAWAQDVAALSPSLVNKSNPVPDSDLKTTSLQEFMNEFKKIYENIYYSYESNTLKSVKVNYDAQDVTTQGNPDIALNKVLATAGLVFEKVKDVYVIKQNRQNNQEQHFAIPAAVITTVANAADFAVRGKISDENGGVAGATVTEKGTNNVTTTNSNGEFAISVSNANAVLVISHVSYDTREVSVSGRSNLDITLDASSRELEQVVVTSLGMKREKRALGYSISSVNAEDMETGGASNVLKSIEGKVTGVQMNSVTSSPTSSVMFNIRGATSLKGIMGASNINNETQPLIVLNGVQLGSNTVGATAGIDAGNFISTLNPNDIESISVLKGASAAALYGSQAGNGVILITTKSGAGAKKGLGISVSSATSFDQAYSAPPVQRRFFQGDEDGSALTEDKKGLGWAIDDKVNNNEPVWRWNILTQEWEESVLEARGDKNPLLAFLRTGVMTDNNVAVTGNYDKGNYRLNLGNLVHNAVIPDNKTTRNSVSFDAKYNINDRLSVTSQASWSHTFVPNQSHVQDKREDNPLAHAMSMPINMPKMSEWEKADPWITDWEGQYQNTPYLKGPGQNRLRYNAVGKNGPYFAAENIIRTYTKDVFFGKIQLDYKIGEPFLLTLRSGISHENFAFERKSPWDAERRPQGIYEQQHSNNLNVRNDLLLSYNKRFLGNRLSLDALGGFSFNYGEANNSGFGGEILTTPNSFTFSSLPAAVRQAAYFNRGYPSRNYGAYATASIGWQNMVYLELSGRNDWVGILGHEKDNHFYPGASLSWIASETFDMGNVFNFLKLRGGYAQTGYGIGRPVNQDSYGISGNTWNGVAMGTIGGDPVDANIKPELNVTKEAGIDFRALDNRISGEFTVYSKNHINQIQTLPVVTSSGFGSILTNMGAVKSTGLEAALTVTPVRTKNWVVNLTGNISTFKSVIDDLDPRFSERFYNYDGASYLALFKGSRVGDMYARQPIGYIQNGKYKGMMLTGIDGIIEEAVTTTDYIKKNGYLGNMNPKAIYGFVADARYKNFRLNVVASMRVGGIFISETQKIMIDDGMADIMALYGDKYNEYWTGGRFAGGLPSMPNPDDMFTGPGFENYREKMQELMTMYNGDPRYFGYWNAVFINPNVDQSQMTPEQKLSLADGDYIKNGDDPTRTLFMNPYNMEGQELWSGAQFRTHDATSFKIKEINLTYSLDRSLAQRLRCQDVSLTVFAKNVMFWAKNKMNEDPETAFYDGVRGMGVADFGLPPIRTMGVRLNVSF
ncbi:SusC/RagA family TonB-linked outer membrane protein [Agriterribacter sp.]|uniref:SusC/RagA family TonB-linked outer membrane protein n=1 Tax=Agriterribacter sp. TaxID=2821509 RepID=UPI002D1FA2CD|nr:SusC/RagA family TonB-linked outer membrane protein [Agriterribacter sp.]